MAIKADDLVREFQTMYNEHWQYIWGHHEQGIVDCSGAFYYVFKKHNLPMYNGSNRIARVYVSEPLIPYKEAKSKGLIVPGMAAFKHYAPGNANYNLKEGYKPKGDYYNGDLNDYHHIGLVDDNVNYVLNAQSAKTGFVRSKITENWTYVAKLKKVIYDGGTDPMPNKTMTVIRTPDASSGSKTVNVRVKPDSSSNVSFTVNFGSIVTVYSTDNGWSQISYGGKNGWMMSKFLADPETLDVPAAVREALNNIDKEMNTIFELIGRG